MIAEYLLRAAISCVVSASLYLFFAFLVSRRWNRGVKRDVVRHDIFLGVTSVLFGSPVLQVFSYFHETRHISQMYLRIDEHGWAWWLVSIPLYVLCWDAVFYATHRVLHWNWVWRNSHFRHHACRPPVPWSGIAIDPLETILSGMNAAVFSFWDRWLGTLDREHVPTWWGKASWAPTVGKIADVGTAPAAAAFAATPSATPSNG